MSNLHRYAVVSSVKRELERHCPGESGPLFPEESYSYVLQTYSIAWYQHDDDQWHPVLVLEPVSHDGPHRWWLGLAKGLNAARPNQKEQVYLCPQDGKAKPDTPYTRTLLKYFQKLPRNDALIQARVDLFRDTIMLNM